jgi:hypothetical protein
MRAAQEPHTGLTKSDAISREGMRGMNPADQQTVKPEHAARGSLLTLTACKVHNGPLDERDFSLRLNLVYILSLLQPKPFPNSYRSEISGYMLFILFYQYQFLVIIIYFLPFISFFFIFDARLIRRTTFKTIHRPPERRNICSRRFLHRPSHPATPASSRPVEIA